jgi:hypothetical protein
MSIVTFLASSSTRRENWEENLQKEVQNNSSGTCCTYPHPFNQSYNNIFA